MAPPDLAISFTFRRVNAFAKNLIAAQLEVPASAISYRAVREAAGSRSGALGFFKMAARLMFCCAESRDFFCSSRSCAQKTIGTAIETHVQPRGPHSALCGRPLRMGRAP